MKYYLITKTVFILLSLACIALVYFGLRRGLSKHSVQKRQKILIAYLIGISIWLAVLATASLSGFASNFSGFPPRMMFVLAVPLVIVLFIASRKATLEILENIPPIWLMYVQSFRIVVELLLWMLFMDNLIPIHLTFEGYNWDILAGISGLVLGFYCFGGGRCKKTLAIIWNIASLGLLINIVVMSVLTFPTSMQVFKTNPDNTIFTHFPFILLPGILVLMAYATHIFSLRQLLSKTAKNQ